MEREAKRLSPSGALGMPTPSVARSREPRRVAPSPVGTRRAVILAGGPGSPAFPLTQCYPPIMFTMFDGRPLIAHMLDQLRSAGVTSVLVALSKGTPAPERTAREIRALQSDDFRVELRSDNGFKGTAGALRGLDSMATDRGMLVIGGPIWLDGLNIGEMWDEHERDGSDATVAVEDRVGLGELEDCTIDEQGMISGVTVRHACCGNEKRVRRPSGVYVLGPKIFDYLDEDGYADIKEQLIPWMRRQQLSVHPFHLDRPVRRIGSLEDYHEINRRALVYRQSLGPDTVLSISEAASVSPDARIIGPVSIAQGAVVSEGATIVGPSVIGAGAFVGAGASIQESILWPDSEVRPGAMVERSVITHAARVAPKTPLSARVVIDAEACKSALAHIRSTGMMASHLSVSHDGRVSTSATNRASRFAYSAIKETMDRLGAGVGLVVLLPLIAVIAMAIKIGSPGPVFFTQRRCGRGGREFGMIKFRTMVPDADKQEAALFAGKTGDGPSFKMKDDPRVTRIGKFLRRSCLDELPQLINVLKGEMSLVGPRPMKMSEMMAAPKWRDYRLAVKPGMTGLWQVRGRDSYAFEDRVRDDIDYVRHRSILMDLRILLQTVRVVLFNRVY